MLRRCLGGDRGPLHFRIMASLRASGRPVPNYDVWIADHAMEIGADFVSAISHFGPISGPHDVIQWGCGMVVLRLPEMGGALS